MAVTVKRVRLVNPQGRRSAHRAPTKKNPAGLLHVLGAVNPQRQQQMKTAKKKSAARKNPAPMVRAMQKQYKPKRNGARRRNPELSGALAKPVEFLKFGLIALLGLVTTRQLPQLALGTRNTSWAGYLANLATAVGGAYGAGKVGGKTASIAWGTGGGLYTVNRILTDKLSPVGQVLSLAGIGDAQASNSLGRITPGAVYPPSYDGKGNVKLPPAFVAAMRRQIAPPAASGAGAMSGTRMSGARIAA